MFVTEAETVTVKVWAGISNGFGEGWFDDVSLTELQDTKAALFTPKVSRRIEDQTVVQDGTVLGLDFHAQYVAKPNHIQITCQLHEPTDRDRAVSVAFRLPLAKLDWNWHYADIPLTFSRTTGKPVQLKIFCDYEYIESLARLVQAQNAYIQANTFRPAHTYVAHLIDVLGAGEIDGNLPSTATFNFLRALCYQKPCTFIDYAYGSSRLSNARKEQNLKRSLHYDIFPGTGTWCY